MNKVKYYGTLSDANKNGYRSAYTKFERGYISRKTIIDGDTPVYISGDGRLFYRKPSYKTTLYLNSVYMVKR